MKTKLSVGDVHFVEATLEVTMSIGDWMQLYKELVNAKVLGRGLALQSRIARLLQEMQQHWERVEDVEIQ